MGANGRARGVQGGISPRLRVAIVGGVALLLLVAMFSIAPARDALAQFLGLFRVQQFAVITVDQEARLENLAGVLESGVLGEPEVLRDVGPEQPVADEAQAEALAGFDVRVPAVLPEGGRLEKMGITVGPHLRLQVDRPTLETAMAMAGMQDVALPAFDSATLEVDAPAAVDIEYRIDNPYGDRDAGMTLVQAPSPEVALPPGIDPAAMGEIFLQAMGMPAGDAARLAQTIDWTSTAVIPLAGDMGSYREVTADGAPALLFEAARTSASRGRERVLLWQRDGIVYALMAWNVSDAGMLLVADSLPR